MTAEAGRLSGVVVDQDDWRAQQPTQARLMSRCSLSVDPGASKGSLLMLSSFGREFVEMLMSSASGGVCLEEKCVEVVW